MKEQYKKFIEGVSINKFGKAGVVLTTSSFFTFIFLEIMRLSGMLRNAYIGLITYLTLPTLFVIGLILIPIGWYRYKKQTRADILELAKKHFGEEGIKRSKLGAPIVRTIVILTLINIFFLTMASMRGLEFMDEPEFCGTACHSVMSPEWTAYQSSPHSEVRCVDCHVGEGVDALVSAKLNGAWQMVSLTFDLYERPIPTPVKQLRPAEETCGNCHSLNKYYGVRFKAFVHYKSDSASTPYYNTLMMKVDEGPRAGEAGIHWHTGDNTEIKFASVNDKRKDILWVTVNYGDSIKKFVNKKLAGKFSYENVRRMDCVDCHNRAAHIYEDPAEAIDKSIAKGLIDRRIPFIKKVAFSALTSSFTTADKAANIIENTVKKFYKHKHPDVLRRYSTEIDNAVEALVDIYKRNIHFEMNVNWDSYPNFLGHRDDGGCFRCHNDNMIAEDGSKIKKDCTLCHSILADESKEPFKFLQPYKTSGKDSLMHKYLQEDLINSKIY